jgi:hypothetical protein
MKSAAIRSLMINLSIVVTEVCVRQGGTWKLGSLSFTRLLGD